MSNSPTENLQQIIQKVLPSVYRHGNHPDFLLALQEVGDFVSSSRLLKIPLEPKYLAQLQLWYQSFPPQIVHRWLALRKWAIQYGLLKQLVDEASLTNDPSIGYGWRFFELLYQVHTYTSRPMTDSADIASALVNLAGEITRVLTRLEMQDRQNKHHQISANGGKALAQKKKLPEFREEARQLWQEYEATHPKAYQQEIADYVFSVIKEKALLSKALRNEDNALDTIIKWCRSVSTKAIARKNRKINRITASCGE